ncbi:MAG: sodium:solute symporter family protein [Planctomycetota bacterium]
MTPVVLGVGIYVAIVLAVGLAAARRSARDPAEYFLAGRGLGTFVLFMALFGTNCTAFVLVGVPGQAYANGIATFGVNAPIVALGIPLTFYFIGLPARRLGHELGALTPAELYAKRLGSRAVGLLLFGVFTLYTLPYMATAVQGAAVTLSTATDGALPRWAGGLGVLVVALVYTSLGGMRATAWTNVVQGALFLGFVLAAIVVYTRAVGAEYGGGLSGAFERVAAERPDLLERPAGGLHAPRAFASWGLAISLTVIAFPHMLARLMAAKDARSLRITCRAYPIALVLLWVPVVLIGVFGALEFPGLEGREVDRVFSEMAGRFLSPELSVLAVVAVLAAVMSTLDAQLLTLGSMLTRDVLDPLMPNRRESADVLRGRLFGIALAAVVYALWWFGGASVFRLASVAFSGYVTLVPTLFLGVRWTGFTAAGAALSILLGNGVYFAALHAAGGLTAAMEPSWCGFLPVAWGFVAACAGAWLGSAASQLQRRGQ